ncbi:hypothetical protein [Zobellia galactanivorans]|uniref:Uncharacterized protein n=1 Tax=Zobellia galactanivorans (strain DSM 12802 / CCUG 47099 / CIP 106680 / NCIMB 13871 / Dsij) TaxID=63186 RepID=G0L3Q4_ZOBGA|nr:hypothetical protein [Zobellia galactanivorans]CAZ95397.1 Putative protein [Zobellia galactanivorans]
MKCKRAELYLRHLKGVRTLETVKANIGPWLNQDKLRLYPMNLGG